MKTEIRKVGIYGTGKVALSFGSHLIRRGFEVGYCGRSIELAQRYIQDIGALSFVSADDLLLWCDAVGFVVSDGAIREVSSGLGAVDKYAFHMSGALAADEISDHFMCRFSLHPLRAFARIESDLSDTTFALEVHENSGLPHVQEIDRFAKAVGRVIALRAEDKVYYHAAAVVASNLLVPLVDEANALLRKIGIDDETLLWPLIDTAVLNMKNLGVRNALTGPIARGDASVVERHLDAMASDSELGISVYTVLSRSALKLSSASESKKEAIAEILRHYEGGER